MEGNGQVLHWSGRVLSSEDLRLSLNGQRELVLAARAIITPQAADELRARNVRVTRSVVEEAQFSAANWAYAQERPDALVAGVVQALRREGLAITELPCQSADSLADWACALARHVGGHCWGVVVFCQEVGLVCCVANKLAGVRAAAVASVAQVVRARQALAANLVAVEWPGRTFYEVRQILRTICVLGEPNCPPGLSCTLKELEGNAHR